MLLTQDRCRHPVAPSFPNLFFIGYYQGGINASTEQYGRQAHHIAYIISEALARGATRIEPSPEAQDAWVKHIRETAIAITSFERECTPSYYNNEGETTNGADGKEKYRYFLGEVYGPGWSAFEQILQNWRAPLVLFIRLLHSAIGPGRST